MGVLHKDSIVFVAHHLAYNKDTLLSFYKRAYKGKL